jgi:Protein of unknown function (DUF2442)
MDKSHDITEVSFEDDRLRLEIDGTEHVFNLKDVSARLLHASPEQRAGYEVSPSGYGIHWPALDEDLAIDALLGATHQPPRRLPSATDRTGR